MCGCGQEIIIKKYHKWYGIPDYISGHNSRIKNNKGMYGKHHSEESKRKMSEKQKGQKHSEETKRQMSGENNANWQGGSSFEPYCYRFNNELKKKIRNRDNRVCQNCGKTKIENGKRLCVHHIHYDKENCYPDLITLCHSCNVKANGNRDYWEEYYMNILKKRELLE